MSGRLTLGFVAAAVLCCAAPALITAGLAGAAVAALRAHWAWAAIALGLVAGVTAAARSRRRRTVRDL